ncbi:DEAD/DEAH box helicase [Corynebacterium efficiens YS-314]|uniref:Putative ATP-dependent RNA helicase n=1 Tax=Corynebacterium efficiens (strain DSM 44549 / YS-314 / AJ 12310 / JCM 11189 / NBRC 100395) TaxID=196164 RepID=Q8FTI3_COREF|nr:DEAD/DEAH box helicase [Corynebacterium efficiens]EEW49768.1 DEAD/DEAH box helicase [Corynebacterium efficiens YS-314]BAC18396.1 putative ATP-dependent RNA helicase [Corynebacterium efficiens YS-314]
MTTFSELNLPDPIVKELRKEGITDAFPIQAAAIPDALAGLDVLGRGPTGSGKTFTFGLPMLARLAASGASRPGQPRGLILVPTRELAAQVRERLEGPAAAMGLRTLEVVGGVNINRNITALASPVDVLVATPGRAQDLVNQKKLSLAQVEITALDEADHMADMGFLPQVRRLMDLTPAKGQRLLFSATLDGDVTKLVDRYMHNPVTHSTAPVAAAVNTMTHYRLLVGGRDSRALVVERIAAREGKTIMFMRTKHGVDRQVKKLRRVGINAVGIHGDKGQNTRTNALAGFTDGSIPVLVATDIAARGIDVDDISLVVHVDPPAEHKAYLHRAGRTARAGTTGTVVTLVMDEQVKEVRDLFRKAGVEAAEVEVHENSPELARITGARRPSGTPLALPGQQPGRGQKSANNRSDSRDATGTPRRRSRSGARRGKRDGIATPRNSGGRGTNPRRQTTRKDGQKG